MSDSHTELIGKLPEIIEEFSQTLKANIAVTAKLKERDAEVRELTERNELCHEERDRLTGELRSAAADQPAAPHDPHPDADADPAGHGISGDVPRDHRPRS